MVRWLGLVVVLSGCAPSGTPDAGIDAARVDAGRDAAARDAARSDGCGTSLRYLDLDGDGYGDPTTAREVCLSSPGGITRGNDCDDGNPDIHLGADETCDGRDEDCDGSVDERDAYRSCSFGFATNAAVCRDGACAIGECGGGYADCNGVFADGCERAVLDDPRSCGGCDVRCDVRDTCAVGTCRDEIRSAWAVSLEGIADDRFSDVAVDSASGDVVVVGTATSAPVRLAGTSLGMLGRSDAVVARFGADGALRWVVREGEAGTDLYGSAITTDDAGRTYTASSSMQPLGPFTVDSDIVITSYSAAGVALWEVREYLSLYDVVHGIAVGGGRFIVVTGHGPFDAGFSTRSLLYVGTTDGSLDRYVNLEAWLTDVVTTSDGFVATGTTSESPFVLDGIELATGSTRTGIVIHFDRLGVATWMVAVPGAPDAEVVAEAIALAPDGGYWVAGTRARPMYPQDTWLRRLDANGALLVEHGWANAVPESAAAVGDDVLVAASTLFDPLVIGSETLGSVGADDGVLVRMTETAPAWALRFGGRAGGRITSVATTGSTRAYLLLEYEDRAIQLGGTWLPLDESPSGVLWAVDL